MQQKAGPRRPLCEPHGTGGGWGHRALGLVTGSDPAGLLPNTCREQEASPAWTTPGEPVRASWAQPGGALGGGALGLGEACRGRGGGAPLLQWLGSLTALQTHRECSVEERRMEGRRKGCPSLASAGVLQQKHRFHEPADCCPLSILVRIRVSGCCVTRKPVLRPEGRPGPLRRIPGLLRGFGRSRREPQLRGLGKAHTHARSVTGEHPARLRTGRRPGCEGTSGFHGVSITKRPGQVQAAVDRSLRLP